MTRALMKLRRKAKADEAAGESDLHDPHHVRGAHAASCRAGRCSRRRSPPPARVRRSAGAIAMLGFGLGTMPLMLGFGAVSGLLGHRFKERMMAVAAIVIVIVGLVMLNRGAMLVGSPVTFDTAKQYALGAPARRSAERAVRDRQGRRRRGPRHDQSNTQYVPSTLELSRRQAGPAHRRPSGRLTRAPSQLAIPQLGVLANLKANGVTVVDVPAAKSRQLHADVRHGHDVRQARRRRRRRGRLGQPAAA